MGTGNHPDQGSPVPAPEPGVCTQLTREPKPQTVFICSESGQRWRPGGWSQAGPLPLTSVPLSLSLPLPPSPPGFSFLLHFKVDSYSWGFQNSAESWVCQACCVSMAAPPLHFQVPRGNHFVTAELHVAE